ncbi:MAG: A/G-specific adenine glycosylase [Prevotella sp.]|nr:A/G-specific adenine glycosylase [Prevotella sp.]
MKKKENTPLHPFASAMLVWYEHHARQLPWRDTHDAYSIWLSEVILQQTRIEQGRNYWLRFVDRWPTVEQLAEASEEEVLRMWQGLGYYSRARHLLAAARQVVAMGGFPNTVEGLRRLEGVGPYTAAAIASMAFDVPAAVVDGNVFRVLSRYFDIDTPINSTQGRHLFDDLATQLLPPGKAAAYNQAVMDFGATWCTPQSPRCADCPLCGSCLALAHGTVNQRPVKEQKLKVQTRRLAYIYIRCKGQIAIHRRGKGDIWQGLWEPLNIGDASTVPDGFDAKNRLTLIRKDVRHVLTHRILLADFYLLDTDQRPTLPPDYIWINEADIDGYAIPRLIEILLESLSEWKEKEEK